MQKQGTITNVVSDGGYNGTGGYVWTFQMTIQCQDGVFTGQIGSKSQTYPLTIGQPITVEMTQTEHGARFKKINPQYAQQNQQQAPPQYNPSSQLPPNDREEKIMRGNALNAVMSATDITSFEVGAYLTAGLNWIKTGVWNLPLQQDTEDVPEF